MGSDVHTSIVSAFSLILLGSDAAFDSEHIPLTSARSTQHFLETLPRGRHCARRLETGRKALLNIAAACADESNQVSSRPLLFADSEQVLPNLASLDVLGSALFKASSQNARLPRKADVLSLCQMTGNQFNCCSCSAFPPEGKSRRSQRMGNEDLRDHSLLVGCVLDLIDQVRVGKSGTTQYKSSVN